MLSTGVTGFLIVLSRMRSVEATIRSYNNVEIKRERMNNVDRVYHAVKAMIVTCQLRPGERINVSELADSLDASRTPVREALYRLASEGLCEQTQGLGFVCQSFDAKRIFNLYEFRALVECGSVRLATERANDRDLKSLVDIARGREGARPQKSSQQLVDEDEEFHITIAGLSGNVQMVRSVANINDQIRFVRGVDREYRDQKTIEDHRLIAEAMMARDTDAAAAHMKDHISKRMDQIIEMINRGVMRLYGAKAPAENWGE
jgi:DNA-binding GntR family transcriptional regulator